MNTFTIQLYVHHYTHCNNVIVLTQCGVLAVRTFRNLIRNRLTSGVQVMCKYVLYTVVPSCQQLAFISWDNLLLDKLVAGGLLYSNISI